MVRSLGGWKPRVPTGAEEQQPVGEDEEDDEDEDEDEDEEKEDDKDAPSGPLADLQKRLKLNSAAVHGKPKRKHKEKGVTKAGALKKKLQDLHMHHACARVYHRPRNCG